MLPLKDIKSEELAALCKKFNVKELYLVSSTKNTWQAAIS
jgi:hypothetical protein